MSNLATTGYGTTESDWDGPPSGRHAFVEDAVLTPIFHALTRGGPGAQREPAAPVRPLEAADPVETFRRNPLTAPMPAQALAVAPHQPWPQAAAEPTPERPRRRRAARSGRHHRRLEVV